MSCIWKRNFSFLEKKLVLQKQNVSPCCDQAKPKILSKFQPVGIYLFWTPSSTIQSSLFILNNTSMQIENGPTCLYWHTENAVIFLLNVIHDIMSICVYSSFRIVGTITLVLTYGNWKLTQCSWGQITRLQS